MDRKNRGREAGWGDTFAYAVAGLVGFLVFAFGCAWFLFKVQVPNVLGLLGIEGGLTTDNAVALLTGFMTLMGGLAIAFMWYWRNAISAKEAETSRLQAKVALDTQISTDLTKAYEQLGSDKMAVRIGAIYTLERVMRDVQDTDFNLYWSIIETLSAFARVRSAKLRSCTRRNKIKAVLSYYMSELVEPPQVPFAPNNLDVSAAVYVIGRCEIPIPQRKSMNLMGLFADGLDFVNLNLSYIDLNKSSFERCSFDGVNLAFSNLSDCNCFFSNFKNSNLQSSVMNNSNFSATSMLYTSLKNTQMLGTGFQGISIKNKSGGHIYMHTQLHVADDLEQDQIECAYGNKYTRLPKGINAPNRWPDTAVEVCFEE